MWQTLLTCQFAVTFLLARGQNGCIGHSTFRSPANTDIQVSCGSERVNLQILLCPIYFNGYNESLLALNSQHSKQQCKGTPDWNVDPPVVKFNFSITEEAITVCSNTMTVTEEEGTGVFADFSSVQYVSISGMVCSTDPSTGAITYHEEVMYLFSCHYPLQYLINNTQMSVSGANLAVNDNNGSFISTLSMQLYNDNGYSSMLRIPPDGLELKTRIFVEVKASNLTNRFNVLLDRCYATASPFPINTTFYDLFVGCNLDGQTVIGVNGDEQVARFSFEAFRFIHSTEATFSTYYVHCATRLCVSDFCTSLSQNCSTGTNNRRRRRHSGGDSRGTTVSDMATVSSMPINIRLDRGAAAQTEVTGSVVAVSVVAAIVGTICFTLVAFIVFHMKKTNKILFC